MDGETISTEVVTFAKKKIRLSQVVDKLAVLGNGNILADKENNNITEEEVTELPSYINEPVQQLYSMTPQLASTVPQTQQVIQQSASTVPRTYFNKLPASLDIDANVYPIGVPQIGSTVPEFLSMFPESGSTILQNFLLYGRGGEIPPPHLLYGFGNQSVNLWQLYLHSQQDFSQSLIVQPEHFVNTTISTQEEIKQEPDDENECMVIDETSNVTNGYQHEERNVKTEDDEKYIDVKPKVSLKSISRDSEKNHAQDSVQQLNNLSPQFASTVPHTYHAVQQTASVISHNLMNHLPVPEMPSHIRRTSTKSSTQDNYPHNDLIPESYSPELKYGNLKYVKINMEPDKTEPKIEIPHMSTDTESEISWRGSNPSPSFCTMNYDQYQQAPLDLSVKGSLLKKESKTKTKVTRKAPREPKRSPSQNGLYPEVRGDVASPTTRESVAARYNMEVSPVVEQMPDGSDTAWACTVCGQLFSQKDRLAKHVACRHRGRSPSRSHVCWSCNRGFSRSDMLTRHLRLHTGQKPYRCGVCGQIFSRSDHLATHRRTHTGEKPYKCPQCSYSACRRDMITRHMRTHRSTISPNAVTSPLPDA